MLQALRNFFKTPLTDPEELLVAAIINGIKDQLKIFNRFYYFEPINLEIEGVGPVRLSVHKPIYSRSPYSLAALYVNNVSITLEHANQVKIAEILRDISNRVYDAEKALYKEKNKENIRKAALGL